MDLTKVHPDLLIKINKVLNAMAVLGFPMRICQGARTLAEQQGLYAFGRTKPGLIVTHADGVVSKSNHQIQADGFGHAVDCCFLTDPFGEKQPWPLYCLMVDTIGLKSGIHFPSPDRPHAELP